MKGFLLVTTHIGKVREAEEEIGDILYPRGEYRSSFTRHPGVFIAWTEIDVWKAYIMLINTVLSAPMKIYPLTRSMESLAPLIKLVGKARIACEIRGKHSLCSIEKKKIEYNLSRMHVSCNPRSSYILHIQGADDIYGYTYLPAGCENYDRIIQEKSLRRICDTHARNALKLTQE